MVEGGSGRNMSGSRVEGVKFELETVTPLFLGGADPRGEPELRAASIRGALRFWLRALLGGFTGDSPQGLERLRQAEARIFGSTERGASSVVVHVQQIKTNIDSFSEIIGGRPGIAYLFFSARGIGREPERKAIKPETRFNITLRSRPAVEKGHRMVWHACAALWLLTRLGGLGMRSRRGAGSLQVVKVSQAPPSLPPFEIRSRDPSELRSGLRSGLAQLRKAISSTNTEVKTPTAFDVLHPVACRIWVVDSVFDTWAEALNAFGKSMQEFRNRRQPDYSTVKQALQGRQLERTVERAAFGLPIVFRFTSLGNEKGTLEGEQHSRRASPLLVHVTRLASNKYALVLTLFYAQFLPTGEQLKLKRRGPAARVDVPDFKLLRDFLDSLSTGVGPLLEVGNW